MKYPFIHFSANSATKVTPRGRSPVKRGRSRRSRSSAVSPEHTIGEPSPTSSRILYGSPMESPQTPSSAAARVPSVTIDQTKIIGRITIKRRQPIALPKPASRKRKSSAKSSKKVVKEEEEDLEKLFCICKTQYNVDQLV